MTLATMKDVAKLAGVSLSTTSYALNGSNKISDATRQKVLEAAKELEIKLQQGVYVMFSGPTYETPAEVRFARIMGGDAVGMSTVPEVIVANHSGIKTVGISCLTNMAAGILDQPLNHEEVIETSAKVKNDFIKLMNKVIEII